MNVVIYPLIFIVALTYSSVGHGGASGYLAVLSLFGFAPAEMASSALLLNILVSGIAFWAFWKEGYFSAKLFWFFASTSIPAAFLGGLMEVPAVVYGSLLCVSLSIASLRLFFLPQSKGGNLAALAIPPFYYAMPTGFLIGMISGIVGVGGGIFLSPILIFMGWADAKHTAAVAACFVFVNSIAGLFGHLSRFSPVLADIWPLVLIAFFGGILGSLWGARKLNNVHLRRILAGVLALAAAKSFLLVLR